jgi:lipopolysaccharide/colanic/teichoic acid biosynthesis glycosyltransferase
VSPIAEFTSGRYPIFRTRQREAVRWVYRPRRMIRTPSEAESLLVFARPRASDMEWLIRVANIVLAALALVVLAPVMLLVALAVKLTSPGPVLYRQERVGLDRRWAGFDRRWHGIERRLEHWSRANDLDRRRRLRIDRRSQDLGGVRFTMYKFRSMYQDAEARTGAVWASRNDPRVTPLGRFLRASRLDELPQLFNVLRGEMNLVGPRPERPVFVERLRDEIEEYRLRQRVKPGITGLAQINHTYDSSIDDVRVKVRYDLEYIRRRSLREDLRIMVRTVNVMAQRRMGW